MAKKLITRLIDDLDGTELESGGESVTFALDGRSYEIDLSASNAEALRETLAPYIKAARRASSASSPASRPRRGSNSGSDLGIIRAWAKKNGFTVSDRGRVPAVVLEAYEAAR